MKRKQIAGLLGMLMGISLLVGCAKTPESALVKQKGKSAEKHYQEGAPLTGGDAVDEEAQSEVANEADASAESSTDSKDASEGSVEDAQTEAVKTAFTEQTGTDYRGILRERLGAPEHYQSEVTDVTGKLKVLTDAQVEIPNASKVSAITVKQHPLDQEQIDLFTETFFGDAVIYDDLEFSELPKSHWQARLEELKGYKAAGNPDPYHYGTDEQGNLIYDIDRSIEQVEQNCLTAPEERILKEVRPQLGLEYVAEDGTTVSMEDRFAGVVRMPGEVYYDYNIVRLPFSPMKISLARRPSQDTPSGISYWMEYGTLQLNHPDLPDEEALQEKIGISLEEARRVADEKVAALGFTDMEANAWEYVVQWDAEEDAGEEIAFRPESMKKVGYVLHYTRKLNEMPVTYTADWGGSVESFDLEMQTWGYERLDLYVTKEGIDKVDFCNRYDIGEIKTENLELLPFSEIMKIYEKMMLVKNADMIQYNDGTLAYKIDRIALGYSRIYEPSADSGSGVLVPVWDFFGVSEYSGEVGGEPYQSVEAEKFRSHLTINAVDGSIIDRGLGY